MSNAVDRSGESEPHGQRIERMNRIIHEETAAISANQITVFDNILFYGTGGFAWSNDQFVRTQLTGTRNSATAGTDEAVNKGLIGWDSGCRYCVRLRPELERLCRVSLHQF